MYGIRKLIWKFQFNELLQEHIYTDSNGDFIIRLIFTLCGRSGYVLSYSNAVKDTFHNNLSQAKMKAQELHEEFISKEYLEPIAPDPKYLDIPNICFSLTDKGDSREILFKEQRLAQGFDESETWALDSTIANFIIPRLKMYLEIAPNRIVIDEDRMKDLKKALKAFQLIASEDILNEKQEKKVDKGIEAFCRIYRRLGW